MLNLKITDQEFRDRFREKQFYLCPAAAETGMVDWSFINDLLYLIEPAQPRFKIMCDGLVDESSYAEDIVEAGLSRKRLRKASFYDLMQRGATAVFNRLELSSPYIRKLAGAVAGIAGGSTAVNAYLSYTGTGTFGKHWDTHDVFVIQLFGSKHWSVHEPTFEFPLREHTSKYRKQECPEAPALDTVLKPGDVLYLPRGWWHAATPIGEPSFHITVGLHQPKMIDYAAWCVTKYLPDFVTARKTAHFDQPADGDIEELAKILAGFIASPHYYEEFMREMLTEERVATPFNLELFTSQQGDRLAPGRKVRLTGEIRTELGRQYMRLNGSLDRRSPQELAILGLLSSQRELSIAQIEAALPGHAPDTLQAGVKALLRKDVVALD
ncbi:cupin domain-containing protein [Massilia sp. METH4]|uniref:JmjC domain-containing protein n=1 Tax=Massilia sp. METH4 TaxID=3123041 RepID=UPI0030D20BA6